MVKKYMVRLLGGLSLPGKGVVVPTNMPRAAPQQQLEPPQELNALSTARSLELTAFLDDAARLESKQLWLDTVRPTISDVAPFLRSEGYVVCVEGLTDAAGDPLILSNGMAHGTPAEVVQQVAYAHERAIEQCVALGRPEARATTIVMTRNPTFRFPDAALRAAIRATDTHYPWVSNSRTIFVGFPKPVRHTFTALKAVMSQGFIDSIEFADDEASLAALVPSLPSELGGGAEWGIERYIEERCATEEVAPPDADGVRQYDGKRLDLALFDRL